MFKGTDVYSLQGPLKLADMVPVPLNVVILLFSFSSFIPVISHKNYYWVFVFNQMLNIWLDPQMSPLVFS